MELNQTRNFTVRQKYSGRWSAIRFRSTSDSPYFTIQMFWASDVVNEFFFPMLSAVQFELGFSKWTGHQLLLVLQKHFRRIFPPPFMTCMCSLRNAFWVSLWRTVMPRKFQLEFWSFNRTYHSRNGSGWIFFWGKSHGVNVKAWHLWFDPKELSSPQISKNWEVVCRSITWRCFAFWRLFQHTFWVHFLSQVTASVPET